MAERDPQAVDILLRTFWSSHGWREHPFTEPEDFEYAKAQRVMFDAPVSKSHDELVHDIVETANKLKPKSVADAFLSSLTTRHLEIRSALGSYAVARLLPEHDFVTWYADQTRSKTRCAICGLWSVESDIDQNVLNFERYKWGGVRRDDLSYIQFDLAQFVQGAGHEPTKDDISLFRHLTDELQDQPQQVSSSKAEAALRAVPSNKAEREVLLDILGVCGVLETADHRGYSEEFVPANRRELPPLRFVELSYPVCWWKGSDGVNRDALATFALPA